MGGALQLAGVHALVGGVDVAGRLLHADQQDLGVRVGGLASALHSGIAPPWPA